LDLPKAITDLELDGVTFVRSGKVRDIYELGDNLLIIASDRISAFDSILGSGIPLKGKVLTALSLFWFDTLDAAKGNHLITADVDEMGDAVAPHADVLRGRSMLVKKAEVVPVECIVRGYLAGSGWKEYSSQGTVCGMALPEGLVESSKLPGAIFTPSSKAENGHDENISYDQACEMHGEELMAKLRDLSVALYSEAAAYAARRGVIICDTKFEWGVVDGELVLIDEILTPDSSRFWPADLYQPGGPQPSYDKQYVRDWLENESGWDKEPPAPALPDHVVARTAAKYVDAYRKITGRDELP
jgi:phosphoribosylaminoimidazole-succinocarboxamide synthase